ncbi:hypothetical protein ECZU51_62530 [Escherichia coli]|nr:hypothetical protein ECZU51_62530 [Escherichia coli]
MLFGTRSEKLRREVELAEALLKQREQDSDRYSGREDDPQVPPPVATVAPSSSVTGTPSP